MKPILLRPHTAAVILNLSVQALAKMRCYGKGPVFVKIGRCVLYRPSDLDKWIASQVRKPKKKKTRKRR
jgi:hypothetical protein